MPTQRAFLVMHGGIFRKKSAPFYVLDLERFMYLLRLARASIHKH